MPLWSGTRRLVISSARFSRFVGEYRCPAIHAAWHRSKIKVDLRTLGSGLASRPQTSECLQQASPGSAAVSRFAARTDDIGPAMRPTRCCENVRGFEPPLSGPVHAALLATLHGAHHAAGTTTGSSHVALGEDLIAPQEASLATSGDAAGRDLAFLDGTPSGSGFRVSDQLTVNARISLRMALLRMGNTWEIPNRHVGSQHSITQEHATHVKRGMRNI